MRFQLVGIDVQTRLIGFDQRQNDLRRDNTAKPHADEIKNTDIYACRPGGNPEPDGHKMQEQRNDHDGRNNKDDRYYY